MSDALYSSMLPALYAGWMDEVLNGQIPDETEATCFDCAMCAGKTRERTEADQVFHPNAKCCTIFPQIPNFQVGRILRDPDPSATVGRLRFLSQLHVYSLATPLGVSAPPEESARSSALTKAFGQDLDLRCPYYIDQDGGLCGIWKFRNAQCSTWFCKHVKGETGLYFWRALKDLLQQIENLLSIWCIHELKAGDEEFRKRFPRGEFDLQIFQKQSQFYYEISRSVGGTPALQAWGDWFGHERDFYEQCAQITDSLNWKQIREIGGSRLQKTEAFLKDCYADLRNNEVPKDLRPGNFRSIPLQGNKVRLWGYSEYDPIDVPREIFDAIETLSMTDVWIRKLYDFGILTKTPGAL